MSNIQFTDLFQIAPERRYTDMDKRSKVQFMDSILQAPTSERKRGLRVNFDLSHSMRRINDRLYPAWGQRDAADSWITPYAKPILVHHAVRDSDPLGRFENVQWIDTTQQAMSFFKDVRDFMKFQEALDSDDPKRIGKVMQDFGLLTNKKWPGIGKLHASALIVDEDAIEKFIDGRYLTFSAGSGSDKYRCCVCGADWAQDDYCDHMPGSIDEDGRVAVFLTGRFEGREASVVNAPADDFGQISGMEIVGAVARDGVNSDRLKIDPSTIYITDALLSRGDELMRKRTLGTEDHVEDATDEQAVEESVEQVDQASEVQAEDAVEESTDDATNEAEAEDSEEAESQEDDEAAAESEAEESVDRVQVLEDKLSTLIEQFSAFVESANKETEDGSGNSEDQAVDESGSEDGQESVQEQEDESQAQEDSQEEEEVASEDGANDSVAVDSTDSMEDKSLAGDYANALLKIQELEERVNELTAQLANDSDSRATIADEHSRSDKETTDTGAFVENPSLDGKGANNSTNTDSKKSEADLGGFEQKFVADYKKILDDRGEPAAQAFAARAKRRGWLPSNFNVNDYI